MIGYKNRSRLPNFTSNEEKFLLILVQKDADIVESKKTDAPTWEKKRQVWEKIDGEFAEKFGMRRGSKNLREKYDNLKRKFKKNLGEDVFYMEHKKIAGENMERLAEILSLTADPTSADEDSDANIAFKFECDMPTTFDETAQSYSLDDDPIRETESVENEHSNQWCHSDSEQSLQNKKLTVSPSYDSKIKETPNNSKQNFLEIEEKRSADRRKWAAERHRRELERHQWEMEKHKLLLEQKKLEFAELKLKAQIHDRKCKHSPIRNRSASLAGSTMPAEDHNEISIVDSAAQKKIVSVVSTLVPQIKIEPTLNITDTPFDDLSMPNATPVRKRLAASENIDTLVGLHKKSKPDMSEVQKQRNKSLTNDMLDMCSADSSCHGFTRSANLQFGIEFGNHEEDEEDAGNISDTESKTTEVTGEQEKDLTNERELLNLLTKHKLQHYFVKLKDLNIDLDCLKHIREVDVRDIFERDIGGRIRFRGLVEDWRSSQGLVSCYNKNNN